MRNSRTTPRRARFGFRTSLEHKLANPLTSMEGYWLSINLAFVTTEQLKATQLDGDPHMDSIGADLSYQIANAPFSVPRYPNRSYSGHQERRWSNPDYFPMAVQFVHPCKQTWNANCVSFQNTRKLRITLIPVLDNPAGCDRIKDRAVREQCHQLNGYWAAFRHTDTVEQFQTDKDLCGQIDRGAVTKTCLENLRRLDPDLFEGRWTEQHRIGATLVMVPVGGLTPMTVNTIRQPSQPVLYAVPYLRTDRERGLNSCLAYVWQATSEKERARAAEATPDMRLELIRRYLLKHPPSS